jgi:hypothetical protein
MFSKRLNNADAAEALRLFLADLQPRENIANWPIQQAKVAIQLYGDHFHGGKIVGIDDDDAKTPLAPFDKDLVMVNMQKAICAKHHSLCRLTRGTPKRGLVTAARCLASFPLLSPFRGYKTCCRSRLFRDYPQKIARNRFLFCAMIVAIDSKRSNHAGTRMAIDPRAHDGAVECLGQRTPPSRNRDGRGVARNGKPCR